MVVVERWKFSEGVDGIVVLCLVFGAVGFVAVASASATASASSARSWAWSLFVAIGCFGLVDVLVLAQYVIVVKVVDEQVRSEAIFEVSVIVLGSFGARPSRAIARFNRFFGWRSLATPCIAIAGGAAL